MAGNCYLDRLDQGPPSSGERGAQSWISDRGPLKYRCWGLRPVCIVRVTSATLCRHLYSPTQRAPAHLRDRDVRAVYESLSKHLSCVEYYLHTAEGRREGDGGRMGGGKGEEPR